MTHSCVEALRGAGQVEDFQVPANVLGAVNAIELGGCFRMLGNEVVV